LFVSNKNEVTGDTLSLFGNKVNLLLSSSTKLPNGKTWINHILEKLSD